jgi:hypothetical protein
MRTQSVVLLAAACVACSESPTRSGNDNDDVNTAGSYTASVTGAVTRNIQGPAVFTSRPGDLGAVGLGTPGGNMILISRYGSGRPGTGTYAITDGANNGWHASYHSDTHPAAFFSGEGQLKITSSTPTRVQGSFSFTAFQWADPAVQVTLTGTFNASCPATACN